MKKAIEDIQKKPNKKLKIVNFDLSLINLKYS